MKKFLLKTISSDKLYEEMSSVGFDSSYINYALLKYEYKNIKIFDLSLPQVNILKQTALSVGADCAIHRDILTAAVKTSDCILGGSISQIKKIVEKLKFQPFSMGVLAQQIETIMESKESVSPKIVGILNVTRDSFSDGGLFYDYDRAIEHLNKLINDGADIIDIGAESTKPYSNPVSAVEQLKVIEPILKHISKKNIVIPISIDTRSSEVAKRAIELGASIINDVSGFDFDKNMVKVCADGDVKVIIQHSQGTPETMQNNPEYVHLVDDIFKNLNTKIELAQQSGIAKQNIIIDLGIGFGKTRKQNFELLNRVDEFKSLGCEVMLGLSRKSLLNMQNVSNDEKDIYTLVLNTIAIERKVDYLRVHNVSMNRKLVNLMNDYSNAVN
ncbi:MAG: dihydropteroate synthase [Candidatus Gastranaerophilaceae bacterium]